MKDEEYAGYCCLVIAILCNLNADESRKMYQYGPEHPLCQKIMRKKVPMPGPEQLSKKKSGAVMKELLSQGYSVDAVSEAFGCFPSTVRRRVRESRDKETEDEDMHLHQFADMVFFEECTAGGTLPATEKYRNFLKKLHPSQLLTSIIRIPIYEITYSYYTKRGNYHVAHKYVLPRQEHAELESEMVFYSWVNDLNQKKPYRKISNAEILDIRPVAYASIRIG